MGRKRQKSNHNNRYTRSLYAANFCDFRKLPDDEKKFMKEVSFTQMRDRFREKVGIPAYDAHFLRFRFGADIIAYRARRCSFTREFLKTLLGGKTPKGFSRYTRIKITVTESGAEVE